MESRVHDLEHEIEDADRVAPPHPGPDEPEPPRPPSPPRAR